LEEEETPDKTHTFGREGRMSAKPLETAEKCRNHIGIKVRLKLAQYLFKSVMPFVLENEKIGKCQRIHGTKLQQITALSLPVPVPFV
jgi:hypothetical protein